MFIQRTWEGSRQERHISMHEQRQIGQVTIILSDDQFLNGYQAGHLQYMLGYRARLLSDEDIYHFLVTNLLTDPPSHRWNAGYVMGWLITMHEKGNVPPTVPSRREGERQGVQP
jgi:hypothetical protein